MTSQDEGQASLYPKRIQSIEMVDESLDIPYVSDESSGTEDFDDFLNVSSGRSIQPYQFEPDASSSEEEDELMEEEEIENTRLQNGDW